MASRMVGRTACPECGFPAAHVKESEKCLYRYCPDCNSQHYAKSSRQRADLMAKTRPIEGSPTATTEPAATPTGSASATTSEPTAGSATPTTTTATTAPAPAPKRRGLFA